MFNLAHVKIDTGDTKAGQNNEICCLLIVQIGAVNYWQANAQVTLSHLMTQLMAFCLACSLSQTRKRRGFHKESMQGLDLCKEGQHS